MTFSQALDLMKEGKTVRRKRWGYHGSNIHIAIFKNELGPMTEAFIYMYKEVDGEAVTFPTPLSCESLLAEDWEEFNQ